MTQSRGWKYRRRDGPPAALASVPPTVARSGRPGSTGQLCALGALRGDVCAGIAPRKDLPRVHRPVWIERVARSPLGVEILGPEYPEHEVVFLEADAVFAGQRAARVERDLQDLRARLHDAVDRLGARIEEQHGVQIAVADVEH